MASEQEYMKVGEVASLLRVSPRHILNMAASGEFPKPIRIGRRIRWSRESVDDWARAQGAEQGS